MVIKTEDLSLTMAMLKFLKIMIENISNNGFQMTKIELSF